MSDMQQASDDQASDPKVPASFVKFIFFVYAWCTGGVVIIYGVRLYQDAPLHPSFQPIVATVFAAAIAFLIVMTLRVVVGPITFKVTGFEFEGASGPIVLWCVCFITVAFGQYLLGIADVTKAPPSNSYISCSVHDSTKKLCAGQADVRAQAEAVRAANIDIKSP